MEIHDYGDAALLVDVNGADDEQNWAKAHAIGSAMRRHRFVTDVVATYHHVFVAYDPLATDGAEIHAAITELADTPVMTPASRRLEVPVVYGGSAGPDLEEVAALMDLTPADVIELHSGADWTIRFVGSPVGAPFLEGPRMPASVPRRAEPRIRVEVGSVAISGFQSMIYNAPSPGGWQLIGRTPLRPFAIDRTPHLPYRAGDMIRFVPIAEGDWVAHS